MKPQILKASKLDPIQVCLLPETKEVEERATWNKDLKLGPRLLSSKAENPNWCENPQFYLNLDRPTHVKIVLRRFVTGKKKNLGANVGLLITKAEGDKATEFTSDKRQKIEKRKKQMETIREAMKSKKQKQGIVSFVRIEPPKIKKTQRKLRIGPKEWYMETQYKYPTVAAFYRPLHQTQGPFIIVPSLSKPVDKDVVAGGFSLTVYSNNPVELLKLDEAKHVVISGEWKGASAGGSHLFSEEFLKGEEASWQANPKYLLSLKGEGETDVEIILSRPQWKMEIKKEKEEKVPVPTQTKEGLKKKEEKKKNKSIVGSMMGLYVFECKRQKGFISQESLIEVKFYPKNEIMEKLTLKYNDSGYVIMPCTFENQQEGPFMLSVNANAEFTFKEYSGDT